MHWTCAAAFLRRFSWTNATSSPWMHPRQEITSCSWPSTDQVDNAIIWLFDTWEGTFTTSPLCCRRVEITRLLSSGAKSPFQVLRFNVWRERFLSNEHSLAYRIIIVNKYSDLPPFPYGTLPKVETVRVLLWIITTVHSQNVYSPRSINWRRFKQDINYL